MVIAIAQSFIIRLKVVMVEGKLWTNIFRERCYQDCLKINQMINTKFATINLGKWFLQKQKTQEQQ